MMTYLQNSLTIPGATSPVNAPFSSQYRFCAPTPIGEPSSSEATAGIARKGGHTTFSTFEIAPSRALMAETRSRASAAVLFIFQFPATSDVRDILGVPLHDLFSIDSDPLGHRFVREQWFQKCLRLFRFAVV